MIQLYQYRIIDRKSEKNLGKKKLSSFHLDLKVCFPKLVWFGCLFFQHEKSSSEMIFVIRMSSFKKDLCSIVDSFMTIEYILANLPLHLI